jgi:hypothetical protein
VATRSKVLVGGRSLPEIAVSNPAGKNGCLYLVSFVCCQEEVPAKDRSLVQRISIEWGVPECNSGASIVGWPWPTRGSFAEGGKTNINHTPLQKDIVFFSCLLPNWLFKILWPFCIGQYPFVAAGQVFDKLKLQNYSHLTFFVPLKHATSYV